MYCTFPTALCAHRTAHSSQHTANCALRTRLLTVCHCLHNGGYPSHGMLTLLPYQSPTDLCMLLFDTMYPLLVTDHDCGGSANRGAECAGPAGRLSACVAWGVYPAPTGIVRPACAPIGTPRGFGDPRCEVMRLVARVYGCGYYTFSYHLRGNARGSPGSHHAKTPNMYD